MFMMLVAMKKMGKVRSYENGMITTIEPGIYISKEENVPEKFKGIGIRIEDDVLVENNQPRVLSSAVKELDDIQHLMTN
jgi:Xaa-Pro aminopeptidase